MKNLTLTFLMGCFILAWTSVTSANPVGISISGKIVEETTELALTGPVAFRVKVLSKDNCILYSEEFTTTLSATGTFTFTLGKGANSVNAYYPVNPVMGQSMTGMNKLFSNAQAVPVTSLGNGAASGSPISSDNVSCPGTYTPVADDFRKVRIEFDNGDSQGYRAIMPYHQIRTVPYAMIAEEAGDSQKLGGVDAADFAKLTDLPDLATAVPGVEADPTVKDFAKANIVGVSGNNCPAGYILTLENNALKCVVDGGSGGGSISVATDSVLGGVMVPSASDIAIDGSGNLTLKSLATSKITGLDTALSNLAGGVKYTDMPATSCTAGQALTWTSPSNDFTCYTISIGQGQVTNLSTDLAGKVSRAGDTMTGALNMGGYDLLATGHLTMSNQKTITVGKYDQTQENTLTGSLAAANEGATWFNSAMNALRFWDGAASQTVVSTASACTDGQILKWNDTTKVWYCAAESGSGADNLGNHTATQNINLGANWLSNGGGNQGIRVDTSGHVGINTAPSVAMLDVKGAIRMSGATSGYVGFQPATDAGSTVWTLPAADGTAGQFLKTDGAGQLSWDTVSGGGGGSDTLAGLSCASGDVASWNGTAWVCQVTGSTNVASSIVKRSPSNAISAGIADFTGVRVFDGVSGYVTLQTPATVGSYTLTLPTGTGSNGQFLTTNGSGVLSWTSPSASLPGLASTNMWVGNGSGVATAVAMSGDATLSNTGALSIATGAVTSTHIANGTIADTDINASAGITRSKIASGTNYGIVVNNGSGVMGAGIACSTTGHVLAWNGTQFACAAPSASLPTLNSARIWVGNGSNVATAVQPAGDVTMSNAGSFTVTSLQSRSVSSTTPTAGQVLMYVSSTWTPTSPTTTGDINSLLQLDASGIATANGVAIKGATTGTATLRASNSFTNYTLTLPADDGNANQVLTTNGSGALTWTTPGGAPTITAKTADFTVATGEDNYFYLVSNATTATLPAVASVPAGFRITIKRVGAHNVNVIANGVETIDGANQRALSSTYQTVAMINTGTEWAIIGGGGGNGTSGGTGGKGGGITFVYTAPGAGSFEVFVGGAGLGNQAAGSGGGGTGGGGSTNKGAGGGGASAVRFTTSSPTDVLLAIAGGGGGGGGVNGTNAGGDGGGVSAATNGATSGSSEFGRAGGSDTGGIGGIGSGANGGAGGSSSGAGVAGSGTSGAAGGAAVTAFSISGGGGGSGSTNNGSGGGGAGYGGGGGGGFNTHFGGGGGGGGYVNSAVMDSFSAVTGSNAQTTGSVLIEWN